MARNYSYPSYDQVPIACRALFTLSELVLSKTCPDPRHALAYPRPRRRTKDEDKKQHPERWADKLCKVCRNRIKRKDETWREWQRRIVCSRKCGTALRVELKKTESQRLQAVQRARIIKNRLRSGS